MPEVWRRLCEDASLGWCVVVGGAVRLSVCAVSWGLLLDLAPLAEPGPARVWFWMRALVIVFSGLWLFWTVLALFSLRHSPPSQRGFPRTWWYHALIGMPLRYGRFARRV